MTPQQTIETNLLGLCIWREARGEGRDGKVGVGCSVRQRVKLAGWWGDSYLGCITKPYQYSSFNQNDPNSKKYPGAADPSWVESLQVAIEVIGGCPDNTDGADSYFDSSLDGTPPGWTQPQTSRHTVSIGRLRFWKTR